MAAKILLAEDEILTRKQISEDLRQEGYEVVEASNGAQALELLNRSRYDLVITDFVMPQMDGFKLMDRVRSRSPKTPVILMSAYLSVDLGNTILQGMAEFMAKPVVPEVLLPRVERLLRSKPL
jgi:CheY-like chemotaxis protein